MEQERPYSELQPPELNKEFHRLFGLVSAIQISMLGTIIGDDSTEMTDDEHTAFHGILQRLKNPRYVDTVLGNPFEGMTTEEIEASLSESEREIYIGQAKGAVAMERRMTFGATLLVKLEDFMPFIQGTDSFKQGYIPREMRRCIRDGVSEGGKDHWLYGNDELGGIFHPKTVGGIEERSLQIFSQDIAWYGVSPFIGRVFEADYDNDQVYRDMVDLGRRWKPEFIEMYKRAPLDMRGQDIQIP